MLKKIVWLLLFPVLFFSEEGAPEKMKAEKDFFQLDEVVVTGSRVEKMLRESPGSLAVVREDKVKSGGDKNAGLAISEIPGVDSGKVGTLGQVQSVMIRGMGSEGTLVLVNGARVNSAYQGAVDFSSLALDNIERIEVLKGPASALYGADAVGGVINIITKDKVTVPSLDLAAFYGTFNTRDLRLSYSGNFSGLSLNLAASQLATDGQRINSDALSNNLNITLGYDFEKNHTLKALISGYKSQSGAPGSTLWPSPLDRQQLEKAGFGLDYRLPLSEDSDLKVKLNGNKNILNFQQSTGETLSEERNFFSEATYTYDFGGINIITVGVSGNYTVLEQNLMGSHNANSKSFFAQDIFDLLGSWIFTASARYDSHSVYGDTFNPMFALVYNIDDGVQIKTSYGTSFRSPTFSDLYATAAMYGVGKPDLLPEKSTSWEVGLNLEIGTVSVLRTTYFNNRIKDFIEWQPVDPTYTTSVFWTPFNIEAETYGIETELKIKISENIKCIAGHTWLVTKNLATNQDLIYRPKNKVNLGVTYELFDQELGVDTEYYDTRLAGSGEMLPGFVTLNIKFNARITKQVELIVSAKNITETLYELRENYPMPGRTLTAGLKLSF